MAKNEFGGVWTRVKLDILEKYLHAYTTALGSQNFVLHYADAFAGTGEHNQKSPEDQLNLIAPDDFLGSVKTALNIEPGFHKYHFNDLNKEFAADLQQIKLEHREKSIEVSQQDANEFVREFCSSLKKNDRAVLFLDPFSSQLNWETLREVAKTEKVDLWLLFPISVIVRMTPTTEDRIRPEWSKKLNILLGTQEWQKALYAEKKKPLIEDLFGNNDTNTKERINVDELEQWISDRLGELFAYVAKPVPLKNRNTTLFLFYFAVSNRSPKAIALANRVVNYIL
ncbi:MAG: three-Cys-motif partner protein TcmP [Gammaproteobacteria bacterium]